MTYMRSTQKVFIPPALLDRVGSPVEVRGGRDERVVGDGQATGRGIGSGRTIDAALGLCARVRAGIGEGVGAGASGEEGGGR